MGFEIGVTPASVEDVKSQFLQVLRLYKNDFDRPWYYGLKMEQSNPHSLAPALGVKESDILEILLLFGIVKKYGQILRVSSKDVECWKQNGELKEFIGDNNVINESLSK